MIKSKMIKFALIATLLFSAFNVAQVMVKCATCQGTGEEVYPNCGGSGVVKPTFTISGWTITKTGD